MNEMILERINKLKKNSFLISAFVILIFSLSLPMNRAQGSVAWTEDFTGDLDDWSFNNWGVNPDDTRYSTGTGYSVVDGILRAPNNQDFSNISMAHRDSTVAYGNWSADWFIASGTDHLAYDVLIFMITDLVHDYNATGLTDSQYLADMIGYGLILVSSSATYVYPGGSAPGITLVRYPHAVILDTYKFAADIEGSHNIEITRNLQGQISVYFDTELKLQATDNVTTTSEKFSIGSYRGDSGFDNITVSDLTIETTTTATTTTTTAVTESFIVWLLFPSLMILVVIRRKR